MYSFLIHTKELRTGSGLHVYREIVEKHGRRMTSDSNDMQTTFNIYLHLNNIGSDGV